MATLNLPDGARVAVWRLVKARLQADAVLSASGVTLVFFDNERGDTRDLDDYGGPVVRFLATLGRMDWFTEASHSGALLVSYETSIPGLDDEDLLNLQEAIEGALYPADNFVFHQGLTDAGAVTGEPLFTSPLATPASAVRDGRFRPLGQFVLQVQRSFTP